MKSTGEPDSMSIGEIAARFGLATHVLRHWESVGLLAPPRAVAAGAATARITCTGSR